MVLLIIDEQTGEWKQITKEEKSAMPKEQQDKTLYLDGFLKKKLDFAMKQQRNDNDVVGLVCGAEGSGKSTLAGNMMRYITKDKFDPIKDMVGSDYEDGINKLKNRDQGGWLMFDEGNVFFLSTEIMKKESRDLHKIFSIFRQKNLFVLIVLPSFFRLNTYFSLDRSRFLCYTYVKGGKRSYFKYYGDKRKVKLWKEGKPNHDMKAVKPLFRGRFEPCLLLENPEYLKFKKETLEKSLEVADVKKVPSPVMVERAYRLKIIEQNPDLNSVKLGKILGIPDRTVRDLKYEIKNKQILSVNQ
ncbi:MAG: hypothetical protein EHM20_00305 [Alphaproteobacteria bacterium]|nr:MAG: hypothetical protein EHM20_00305 [Alphaproteobacteria bacterium]